MTKVWAAWAAPIMWVWVWMLVAALPTRAAWVGDSWSSLQYGIHARHHRSFKVTRSMTQNGDASTSTHTLDPTKTALVLIEYQNEFTTPGGKLHDAVKEVMEKTNMLENSHHLASVARNYGCTILHCPISFQQGHLELSHPYGILAGVKEGQAFLHGSWGADFSSWMIPHKGDLIVKGKSGLCGFASTNLDFLLRQRKIENVILGGFLTNCCVESTMRTAYEKGYTVYTVQDCMATTSLEAHEATIQHNFGMFSIPTTSHHIIEALASTTTVRVKTL